MSADLLEKFLPPEVAERLRRDPGSARLGAETLEISVLSLSFEHVERLSENVAPRSPAGFYNHYTTLITDAVLRNGGCIDKYAGGTVVAFWNASRHDPDHRAHACQAALDCLKAAAELDDAMRMTGPALRAGLDSGPAGVGFFGSSERLQFTAVGPVTSLAGRLEGANRFFGTQLIASASCYRGAFSAAQARLLGSVRVVGRESPVDVFELLGRHEDLPEIWRHALGPYNRGIDLFRAGKPAEAKAEFNGVLKLLPDDKVSRLYLSMCDDFRDVPPSGAPPVFNLTAS